MAELAWCILCTRISVDPVTNNLTLGDIIEEAQVETPLAPDEPVMVPVDWRIIAYWRRSDRGRSERIMQRLSMRAPTGMVVPPLEIEVPLDVHPTYRFIATLQVLTFRGSGTYEIVVEQKPLSDGEWSLAAIVPLGVTVSCAELPEDPSPGAP